MTLDGIAQALSEAGIDCVTLAPPRPDRPFWQVHTRQGEGWTIGGKCESIEAAFADALERIRPFSERFPDAVGAQRSQTGSFEDLLG